MKIGIVPINLGEFCNFDLLAPFVQEAEAVGYESMWTFEHVIIPKTYESIYPYSPSGKLAFGPESEFMDPLIQLNAIASVTKRLRLGTGVNILPQVSPLYFAKQTACIDHLSGGRLMLGLGVGWLEEEFYALGVPFERRGERMDEYLTAFKQAWTGQEMNFKGEFLDWHNFQILPPSAQKPHIPIVIGGVSKRAIRRVAEFGDGWYVIQKDMDELRNHFKLLDQAMEKVGRKRSELEITSYWNYHKEGLDTLKIYRDLGIDRLLINVHALRMGDAMTAMRRFADEVFPKIEAA